MQRISLTLVLVIGVVGGVVIGYAADSLRSDVIVPFPTATVVPATMTPVATATLQTTLPNCDDPAVQVGQLCVRGKPYFPKCWTLGPTTKVSIACHKDPPK